MLGSIASLIIFGAIVYFGVKYLEKVGFIFPWSKKELVIKLPSYGGGHSGLPPNGPPKSK